ncbi:MAG: histidine kinase [Saprospiraceae bacterium]|nr:histidine kinase [Saprospiraceae bacterium]
MKNKKYGKAFWPIQIGGWGLLMVLTFWAKILHDNDISDSYFLVEGLIFFSLAIATTTILRSYLIKIRLIDDQSVPSHQHLGMSALEILVNYINITLYVIMWCVLYIVIKSSLKLRNEKIRRLELEAALKEAQLNTLKSQINPHFMFNSLNNIRALIL